MKIKSLQLKNFKRFTDLTIQDIPEDTKLVLLIGSNGSGKSSVFDAFERIATESKERGVSQFNKDFKYYSKDASSDYKIELATADNGILQNDAPPKELADLNNFYGRTSFRQIPKLLRTTLGTTVDIQRDTDRPKTFIERDSRLENDLEHIFGKLLREYFITKDSSEINDEVIVPLNIAFEKIFGTADGTTLRILELIPPLEGKTAEVNFEKGASKFHYNQLSAGEKEIFNILINLIARKEYFRDTIYFFDEIDLHLNTKLQYRFLKEITENWIPENCQLWTASHSLGFIDYANDYDKAVIIDFDDLDFDLPQVLRPKPKNDFEIFEIAVGKAFIDKIVQGRKIIFSENTDTPLYNNLAFDNVLFFVANDKTDVFHKAKNYNHYGLMDRDYLTDEEIREIKEVYPFLFILNYYSIENLFYHPANLEEYYKKTGKPFNRDSYTQKLTALKNDCKEDMLLGITQARSGYPFFKENEHSKLLKKFKEKPPGMVDLLKSNELEQFYKVFPMKDYATQLPERQNLQPVELAKTDWFRAQIESVIQ